MMFTAITAATIAAKKSMDENNSKMRIDTMAHGIHVKQIAKNKLESLRSYIENEDAIEDGSFEETLIGLIQYSHYAKLADIRQVKKAIDSLTKED